MPERIRDGLRVVSFGLRQFEQFGREHRLSVPEQLDLSAIFEGILDQLINTGALRDSYRGLPRCR
jgi:hypothetical protein